MPSKLLKYFVEVSILNTYPIEILPILKFDDCLRNKIWYPQNYLATSLHDSFLGVSSDITFGFQSIGTIFTGKFLFSYQETNGRSGFDKTSVYVLSTETKASKTESKTWKSKLEKNVFSCLSLTEINDHFSLSETRMLNREEELMNVPRIQQV